MSRLPPFPARPTFSSRLPIALFAVIGAGAACGGGGGAATPVDGGTSDGSADSPTTPPPGDASTGDTGPTGDAATGSDAVAADGPLTGDFTITVSPSIAVGIGFTGGAAVAVQRSGGFSGAVTVTVSGLPAGVTASALVIDATSSAGELTLAASSSASAGQSAITVTGTSGAITATASSTLDVLAAHAGALDGSFGQGGTVWVGGYEPYAMAVQSDGKILVAVESMSSPAPFVLRYGLDGSLDPSFGTAGAAALPSEAYAMGSSIAVQADGDILVTASDSTESTGLVVRLLSSGAPDTTFGTGGVLTLGPLPQQIDPDVLAVQSDGKIVVGSDAPLADDAGLALTIQLSRYLADGSPDTSFGSGGSATPFAPTPLGIAGLVLQPDGEIVSLAQDDGSYQLARASAAGAADTTFVSPLQAAQAGTLALGPVLQSDGALLVGSYFSDLSASLQRFLGTGAVDTGFGADGSTGVTYFPEAGLAADTYTLGGVVVEASGRIVVAGTQFVQSVEGLYVRALTTAGALDTAFGAGGETATAIGSYASFAVAAALEPDGRIVVLADGYDTSTDQAVGLALARYWP